ncbi:MAG: thioredoxin family protein, partial [Clostridia bacterium]|nr:thioredoxin family protein [Clostridia bacterium]
MKDIDSVTFDQVISDDTVSVVDFFGTWCMPCKRIRPILEKVDEKLKDVNFYGVDVDDCHDIAARYRVFSVPTIMCFRSGKKLGTLVGLNSFDEILDFVKECEQKPI